MMRRTNSANCAKHHGTYALYQAILPHSATHKMQEIAAKCCHCSSIEVPNLSQIMNFS